MRILSLTVFALIISFALNAQTWQWGKRGGSQFNGINNQPDEQIKDIATDNNGNVYALGLVESSGGANVDGHSLTLYGGKDVVLTSFTCNGIYRWTKIFGGASDDYPLTMAVDTLGHVYISCYTLPSSVPANVVHFSTDSVQSVNSQKTVSLIQYDTAGTFKWLRQPSPDTGGLSSNPYSYDMVVDGNGNLYWALQLGAGLVSGGGWAAPVRAPYILKYNSQGQIVDHTALQMQSTNVIFQNIKLAKSSTGKFILAGTYDPSSSPGTFSIGSQTIIHSMFMAAFNSAGQNVWKKENTLNNAGSNIFSRPQVDAQGNVYYSGGGQFGDSFNGFSFYNNQTSLPYTTPFIGKADSNGNNIWIKCAGGKADDAGNSIVLKGNNEVVMSGSGNSVWWNVAHHIQGAPNCGYYVYSSRFDASGNILGMDSLKGTFGSNNYTYCNAVDKNGNLFIGGEFSNTLNITGTQSINNAGGDSDFFITKFGYSCGCIAPLSNFTSTITAVRTVQFTYNGTTTTIDSLRWNFGDGQSQKVTSNFTAPLSHTYAGNGSYSSCATVYNSCGSNSYCKGYSLSVGGIGILEAVKVYPNPVTDNLIVEGAEGSTAFIINSLGQQVVDFEVNSARQTISLCPLPSGVYTLIVLNKNGNKEMIRMTKQ